MTDRTEPQGGDLPETFYCESCGRDHPVEMHPLGYEDYDDD